MKVIFLDIDGVMNSREFYHARYTKITSRFSRIYNRILSKIKWVLNGCRHKTLAEHKTPKRYYTYEYQLKRLKESTCPQKWEWLAEFCNEHNVKICVSSVWRNHFGPEGRREPAWWGRALTDLGFKEGTFIGITTIRGACRGEEIQHFLNHHPEIEDYAILDDDSDMIHEQFKRFHHCDPWFGLNPNHLYRIKFQFENGHSYINLNTRVLKYRN